MKWIPAILWFSLTTLAAQELSPKGAQAALAALPPQYAGRVLQLTGDKGTPEPAQWVIYARVSDDDDSEASIVHTIVVADGQVISDNQAANLLQVFRGTGYFGVTDIQEDSSDIFLTVTLYATANDRIVNTLSYKLVRNNDDSAPVWTVTAFDPNGIEIGWLKILATTGAVIGQKGFPKAPSIPN